MQEFCELGGLLLMKCTSAAIQSWFATLALGLLISMTPGRAQSQNPVAPNGDSDLTRQQLAAFDRFLDGHPELAQQLRKDPSLVNNEEFVENHSDLQRYLQEHPEVRQEVTRNPNAVMHQEQRDDQQENRDRDKDRNRGSGDITRGELANMDRFMDSHPEIAEQLRKDPSLVDNKEFVQHHPALQEYLASHPEVREEYKENPNGSMRQEQHFDRSEDSATRRSGDVNRGQVSSFHEFLEGHDKIAGELSKNPSLATNQEYLENHPALHEYLQAHPQVRQELRENPQAFVTSAQQFGTTPKATPKAMADPKLK
jgi:hypothetical protein